MRTASTSDRIFSKTAAESWPRLRRWASRAFFSTPYSRARSSSVRPISSPIRFLTQVVSTAIVVSPQPFVGQCGKQVFFWLGQCSLQQQVGTAKPRAPDRLLATPPLDPGVVTAQQGGGYF